MANYGFPYKGSKKKIADRILEMLPQAANFYDLFAGGCAVTHAVLEKHDLWGYTWDKVFCNDIQGTPQLFVDAIQGKYKNENRWISREEFNEKKDTDQYIKWIWSFGNNGRDYMFGKDIEELKRQAHEYVIANGYDGTPTKRIHLLKQFKKEQTITDRFDFEQLERLQQLQQLERLQRLEQLQRLERLQISFNDYREIEILSDSVIYCDPPYQNTNHYGIDFDHAEFWEWVRDNKHPVYVSEYKAPDDIKCIASFEHRSTLSSTTNNLVIENLYWNGV
jgi:site-specific DNA-adenine methylase